MRHGSDPIPRDTHFDDTFALLNSGYEFISDRCRRLDTDAFTTRILLKPVTCTMGEDAARMFYQPDRFTRKKAMPPTTLALLQDIGSVQWTDGEPHHRRKRMFMAMMTETSLQQVVEQTLRCWRDAAARWQTRSAVVLHQEVREVLCRAGCRWAGIPMSDAEIRRLTRDTSAMIDGAGAFGPRNWKALALRQRSESWARDIIERVRSHYITAPADSPVGRIAWYREDDGAFLDSKTAAVELLNLVRPTVAIGRFVVFAALALHEHPECRTRIEEGDDDYLEWFVHEVRRYYPFFPCIGGRVKESFEWHGHHFERGEWVLLDLYGTNHDERTWQDPETFRPERFAKWDESAFNFVPQGGGDFYRGHRCPGERMTIEVTKALAREMVTNTEYLVPEQDLSIDLRQMPAIPASGFIMERVHSRSIQ